MLNTVNILAERFPLRLTEEDQETEETLKNFIMISLCPVYDLLHDAVILLVILQTQS